LVKIRTRKFAKRQMTWFKKQAQPEWIQLEAGNKNDDAVTKILMSVAACDTI
jgi:tRNA A37 N6-isopentenylltransferase MiaA